MEEYNTDSQIAAWFLKFIEIYKLCKVHIPVDRFASSKKASDSLKPFKHHVFTSTFSKNIVIIFIKNLHDSRVYRELIHVQSLFFFLFSQKANKESLIHFSISCIPSVWQWWIKLYIQVTNSKINGIVLHSLHILEYFFIFIFW